MFFVNEALALNMGNKNNINTNNNHNNNKLKEKEEVQLYIHSCWRFLLHKVLSIVSPLSHYNRDFE
jgi:hypothetical protein